MKTSCQNKTALGNTLKKKKKKSTQNGHLHIGHKVSVSQPIEIQALSTQHRRSPFRQTSEWAFAWAQGFGRVWALDWPSRVMTKCRGHSLCDVHTSNRLPQTWLRVAHSSIRYHSLFLLHLPVGHTGQVAGRMSLSTLRGLLQRLVFHLLRTNS